MQFTRLSELPDIVLIEPRVHHDERGFFLESYQQQRFERAGLPTEFVQDNHSRSKAGVLRGLHFQHPKGQGKLVRVVRGEVYDVAVDIRVGSPTFGRWVGLLLSEENQRALYIPPGFAHGFVTTREETDLVYKCTELYHPEHEGVLAWDDPEIGIDWPIVDPLVSTKDAEGRTLGELEEVGRLPTYEGVVSTSGD